MKMIFNLIIDLFIQNTHKIVPLIHKLGDRENERSLVNQKTGGSEYRDA